MTTRDCRLFSAASTAYGIAPDGTFTPRQPFYDAVGYVGPPSVIFGGPTGIDACLVGRSTDGIVVAFRGTLPPAWNAPSLEDWFQDLLAEPKAVPGLPGKVHSGFYDAVKAILPHVMEVVTALVAAAPDAPLFVTGHSKGGPMASIFSQIVLGTAGLPAPTAVTFASPHPGDVDFAKGYAVAQTSYENYLDVVPFLPPTKAALEPLKDLPILGPLLGDAADWNYAPVGDRKYIEASGQVVDDTPLLDIERTGEIALSVVDNGGFSQVLAAHCSGCKGAGCAGGYARGVCGGAVCG